MPGGPGGPGGPGQVGQGGPGGHFGAGAAPGVQAFPVLAQGTRLLEQFIEERYGYEGVELGG